MLRQRTVSALTLWRTIFIAPGTALAPELLLHELRHMHQFQGSSAFPILYVWESLRRGYHANRYEVDARTFADRRVHDPRTDPPEERCNVVQHTPTSVVTIERFIIEQERLHPEATGELSGILYDLALAAKMIANKVRMAGLADILGATDMTNVQGEVQQKLDVLANEVIVKAMDHGGRLCGMASEEEPDIIHIPEGFKCGKYLLLFDPLDGSSNIDVNVPVGTIFSVVRKITRGTRAEMEDLLQPGRRQVAAGYVIYGSSTMLVYTTGQGVHGFTLDPSIGEFLLSHPDIRIPANGRYLSVNDSYEQHWDEHVRALMRRYRGMDGEHKALNVRYVGSLVADFHRNLLGGGVFCYPANARSPRGKLRLLYECNPLAFVCEQAGGAASDGTMRIMDVAPSELHQRSPLYLGSRTEVELATEILGAVTSGV
jgi:fructose-1,6-bisphosphatase I